MTKKVFLRAVACALIMIMSITLCSTVFADAENNSFVGTIPESSALINAEIITEFNEKVDMETGCLVNLEYDSQGRIKKITGTTGNTQEVINISHNEDGTYTKESSVSYIDQPNMLIGVLETKDTVELMSSIGNYDEKMADSAVNKRIKEAQEVWNNVYDMRDLAHIEAEVARADYCVVYPKSTFAELFLESGSLNNGTAFRRTLQYTSPQMYGSDIIALQRALMAYGYLESTDVKPEEYGYFGPTTQAAVEEYQKDKGLSADGIAGNNTLKSMFSAGSINNKAQTSFEGLNKINVFRLKHDAVCTALAAKLGPTIYREAYIDGAGLKGKGGRADVIRVNSTSKMVWEVKPDSLYGVATGARQVATYVTQSTSSANRDRAYCPLTYGTNIVPFSFNWTNGQQVYVSSTSSVGPSGAGVVYYSDRKGLQPIWVPEYSPVLVPKPNEDYARITWPEPQTVYNGLVAVGVVVATYYIVKGIIAIAASVPSGGTSLLLLCF